MKNLSIILLVSLAFLVSCGLSSDYELAMNPPANTDTAYDIFPEEIDGKEMKLNKPSYGGMEGMYGDQQSIYVARLSSKEEAMAFFKTNLLPGFKEKANNFSATVNGQFYAKASGNSQQLFGWVNQNFAFVIKGADKNQLNQIVEKFDFISPK
ncbi:MAG: hypothetical protein AAFQ94_07625 [Bacteroidota bacterium]